MTEPYLGPIETGLELVQGDTWVAIEGYLGDGLYSVRRNGGNTVSVMSALEIRRGGSADSETAGAPNEAVMASASNVATQMTDINNSTSGHRLPLLVGDVVRMGEHVFMLTAGGGNLVGTALNGTMVYWTRGDGKPYAPPTQHVHNITEILGGALR